MAQDSSPTGPTLANIATSCNSWHTVVAGDGCWAIENEYGITHENFILWNPDISDDCATNFWAGYAYCVRVGAVASRTSKSTTSSLIISTSSTTISNPISTSSSVLTTIPTTTLNATYSIRVPVTSWNSTSTTVETAFPPKKTQPGQPSYCNNWHHASVGDTCQRIVGSTARMTLEQL